MAAYLKTERSVRADARDVRQDSADRQKSNGSLTDQSSAEYTRPDTSGQKTGPIRTREDIGLECCKVRTNRKPTLLAIFPLVPLICSTKSG